MPGQTIRFQAEAVAKAFEGVRALGKDEKKVAAGLDLLVNGGLPVIALDSYGLQKFLGLITHGRVYADKPENPSWVNAPKKREGGTR